jgi:ABC-2 type transport system ATP-binding protein
MDGIEIRGLVKDYPRSRDLLHLLRHPLRHRTVTALDGIDLTIPRGGIYALLGPNGAGKTTLLKILGGLLLPNAGTIRIDGDDLTGDAKTIRERVGLIVCDERSFYWRLTAKENLRFFATLYGFRGSDRDAQVMRCLTDAGIEHQASTQFMRLSTGMRQRLAVARGLLLDPSILLMDEATRSLDPESRSRIHSLVTGLIERDPDRIILYSTHDLAEAELISGHVIVIRSGKIATEQQLGANEMVGHTGGGRTYRIVTTPEISPEDIEDVAGASLVHTQDGSATVRVSSLTVFDDLVGHLRSRGLRLVEAAPERSSLMDLYMASMGKPQQEQP